VVILMGFVRCFFLVFSFVILVRYSMKSTIMHISMAISIMEISKDIPVACPYREKLCYVHIELMNCESLFL